MAEENANTGHAVKGAGSGMEGRLSTIGWGLFFAWVGVALLTGLSEGLGLLGVGVITLGVQGVRKLVGLSLEGFWVIVGLFFTLGGLGSLSEAELPLVPIALVVAGLLLVASALTKK